MNEITIKYKMFDSEKAFGYKQITTFYMDFGLAEPFGERALKDTYVRCLDYAKTDYKYLTELVLVLNWKIWEHYEAGNKQLANFYDELWVKADNYASKTLKGDELDYFLDKID